MDDYAYGGYALPIDYYAYYYDSYDYAPVRGGRRGGRQSRPARGQGGRGRGPRRLSAKKKKCNKKPKQEEPYAKQEVSYEAAKPEPEPEPEVYAQPSYKPEEKEKEESYEAPPPAYPKPAPKKKCNKKKQHQPKKAYANYKPQPYQYQASYGYPFVYQPSPFANYRGSSERYYGADDEEKYEAPTPAKRPYGKGYQAKPKYDDGAEDVYPPEEAAYAAAPKPKPAYEEAEKPAYEAKEEKKEEKYEEKKEEKYEEKKEDKYEEKKEAAAPTYDDSKKGQKKHTSAKISPAQINSAAEKTEDGLKSESNQNDSKVLVKKVSYKRLN